MYTWLWINEPIYQHIKSFFYSYVLYINIFSVFFIFLLVFLTCFFVYAQFMSVIPTTHCPSTIFFLCTLHITQFSDIHFHSHYIGLISPVNPFSFLQTHQRLVYSSLCVLDKRIPLAQANVTIYHWVAKHWINFYLLKIQRRNPTQLSLDHSVKFNCKFYHIYYFL